MTEKRFHVEHRPDEQRYVLIDRTADGREIGEESYVDVADDDGATARVLFHTAIAADYGSQGLASLLVQSVVDDVVARGYTIVPVCPYVAKWLPEHPQYDEHVVDPAPVHLAAVKDRQQ